MSLEEVLKKAVERIHSGSLENEAQVKQAVIVPVLRALDWDDSDPAEFVPEFSADNGRVDYALLRSGGGPLVFIEAKGLGGVDAKGEEQVFRYAVNRGVPFLILTDGNLWDFYLSMAAGDPPDRQFYRVELTNEERISEYVEFFEKHLLKSRVVSEEARLEAEQRLKSNRERGEARKAIPGVWRTLLETPDDMLRDLIAEEVARACGTRPKLDDVEAFLKGLLSEAVSPTPRSRSSKSASTSSRKPEIGSSTSSRSSVRDREPTSVSSQPTGKPQSTIVGFVLDGERFETGAAYRTLAEVLKVFDRRAPDFMERLAEETVGRRRRLVARNRNDLYDNPKFVEKSSLNLRNGWWLGHHLSTKDIQKKIEIACEVAGIKFGSQLTLIER